MVDDKEKVLESREKDFIDMTNGKVVLVNVGTRPSVLV